MTRILTEIRRLEDAVARGEIDAAELARLRVELLDLVEEADTSDPPTPRVESLSDTARAFRTAFAIAFGLIVLTLAVAWVASDILLGLTLSITVLAAILIHSERALKKTPTNQQVADLDDATTDNP